MYSNNDIIDEIRGVIDALEDHQHGVPSWITQGIVSEHSEIEGADKDFYLLCAYAHVRTLVAKELNRFKVCPDSETDPQGVLPGFKRLQKRYLVKRDGEQLAVPVGQLTDEEIDEKIGELGKMSAGLSEHMNELRRYKASRWAA